MKKIDSWYGYVSLSEAEQRYINAIESIWRVRNAKFEWVPYILAPHQVEWHKDDVAIQHENAYSRIVVKSRNTSFTTSAIISNLMAVPFFPGAVIPFIRLNIQRAGDMISEAKELIRHMNPLCLPNGQLFPFDPSKVNMEHSQSIKFPNGFEIRAFPATSAAAENIRGLRIVGSAGIIDESNFMRDFKALYIASRDASSGSLDGQKVFQMNIGTTLKGLGTPFKLWFDDIKTKADKKLRIKIYEWPVFDPTVFDIDKEPILQPELVPIVPWHSIPDLNGKYLEDKSTFLQEYMAKPIEADSALYKMSEVLDAVEEGRVTTKSREYVEENEFYFGVDPAGEGGDYFSIVGFNANTLAQDYLFSKNNSNLEEMQNKCERLLTVFNVLKMRIDGNGLGYQLAQTLKKKYPGKVEIIRGSFNIKIDRKQSIPFKEYMHMNIKKLLSEKRVTFIDDEMLVRHFTGWNYNYDCERSIEYGHGDIVVAIGLALLPKNWKSGEINAPVHGAHTREHLVEYADDVMKRIEWYKQAEKQRKRRKW